MMKTLLAPSAWAVSGMFHGALALGMLLVRHPSVTEGAPPPPLEFVVAPTPPKPTAKAAPTVAQAPTATHAPQPAAIAPPPPTPSAAPPPEDAPPPQNADAPLDLTGTTLTADVGAFSTRVGNGAPMAGPIGAGRPAATGSPRATASAAVASAGPTLTLPADLSRLPEPPDLSGRLLDHYPDKARATGTPGRATLSLVISAQGLVVAIELRSATDPEFGRACEDTLRGTHWSLPLDRSAKPTATRVGYTCQFEVR